MFIRCGCLGGGERSDQGHHRARRVLRERAQAVQEAVREGRAPVGVQEATALREAQRPAQAEGPRRPQESQASRTDGRLAVTLLDVPPALPSPRTGANEATRLSRRPPTMCGGLADPGTMRRSVEAGHTWERSTEWNAVRALLAHEAQTEMGRELVATAEPLTDPRTVHTQLRLTRQARLARVTAGPLPPDSFPDVRQVLDRCRTVGSVLDGAELAGLVPALLATPRLAAYGKSIGTVAAEVAAIIGSPPRVSASRRPLGQPPAPA